MINVAIIEDNDSDYNFLSDNIDKYSKEKACEFSISRYVSALKFLSEYKADADIIFIDIELPDINGVEASEKLRLIDENVPLVFITNIAHLAIKGYGVSATDFIVKPVNYYKLQVLLTKLIKLINAKSDDMLSVQAGHYLERIRLSDINYIEIEAHKITYHTFTKDVVTYGSMNALEKSLPLDKFYRCYQSYIINLKHVISYDGENITMKNDVILPVSRSKRKEIMTRLSKLYLNGGS